MQSKLTSYKQAKLSSTIQSLPLEKAIKSHFFKYLLFKAIKAPPIQNSHSQSTESEHIQSNQSSHFQSNLSLNAQGWPFENNQSTPFLKIKAHLVEEIRAHLVEAIVARSFKAHTFKAVTAQSITAHFFKAIKAQPLCKDAPKEYRSIRRRHLPNASSSSLRKEYRGIGNGHLPELSWSNSSSCHIQIFLSKRLTFCSRGTYVPEPS